jgi:hypothetical protein
VLAPLTAGDGLRDAVEHEDERIRTSAAAQPAACSPGSGDSENTKIETGSVGSAFVTSVETWFAAIEDVKRSGAVSRARRLATSTRSSSPTTTTASRLSSSSTLPRAASASMLTAF